jgi:hypothetical protein
MDEVIGLYQIHLEAVFLGFLEKGLKDVEGS